MEPARFHAAEIAVQKRVGVGDEYRQRAGASIRTALSEQARLFFENLPILFLGLIDSRGRPWATLAAGPKGFARAASPDHLTIGADPVLVRELDLETRPGSKIAVLGIELPTRRRNRINGTIVDKPDGAGLTVMVDQSFGNCPQYIQRRVFDSSVESGLSPMASALDVLSPAALEIIQRADTFFIASRTAHLEGDATAGLDVSHRGGRPGFLHVNGDGSLSFPDFAGNRFFNTLGNIADDGRVGLLVPEFNTGHALYLTGEASIDWDSDRVTAIEGAERIIDVKTAAIHLVRHAFPATATLIQPSPRLDETGLWPQGIAISRANTPVSSSQS
jgi:predicted pyridoxine 5'-phosphate oxidase superfamily flavin-nucleotide-binding protein